MVLLQCFCLFVAELDNELQFALRFSVNSLVILSVVCSNNKQMKNMIIR
jgi:hypothetical protein